MTATSFSGLVEQGVVPGIPRAALGHLVEASALRPTEPLCHFVGCGLQGRQPRVPIVEGARATTDPVVLEAKSALVSDGVANLGFYVSSVIVDGSRLCAIEIDESAPPCGSFVALGSECRWIAVPTN
jgi:hypothetical protein